MAKAPQRPPVPGPAFIRLLARVTDIEVPPSSPALAERLSQWLDWTRAVALSKALDGRLPAAETEMLGTDASEQDECARVRATLAAAIADDGGFAAPAPRGAAPAATPAEPDYAVFRQRYVSLQRSMQTATGRLRGRLRELLGQGSADMARLAEVDAVMELTLSPREQALLASVPEALEKHFQRLRGDAPKPHPDTGVSTDVAAAATSAWLDLFRRDMQSVLLAELDVRFQPIEGLLAALRTRQLGQHVQKQS